MKNGFVFLPPFFAGTLSSQWFESLLAFIYFCLMASAVYVFNDLRDVKYDKAHPEKRKRPYANGDLKQGIMYGLVLGLSFSSLILSYFTLPDVFSVLLFYLGVNILYSIWLKHIALLDLMIISLGFILRIYAGGYAVDVEISQWLILMTFLLSVFIGLGKRRDDLVYAADASKSRPASRHYNLSFIDSGMIFMASVMVVVYILYTLSPDIVDRIGRNDIYLSSILVVVGLLRYMQLTFVQKKGGSPTALMVRDPMLVAVEILWFGYFYFALYA